MRDFGTNLGFSLVGFALLVIVVMAVLVGIGYLVLRAAL